MMLLKFLFIKSFNSLPFSRFFDKRAKSYSWLMMDFLSSSVLSGKVAMAALLVLSIRV